MRLILTVLAGLALIQGAAAQQYPTIVGTWYDEQGGPKDCQSHWGWQISPMRIDNAVTTCQFNNVSRDGWEVTWTGTCSFEGDPMSGNKVIATERSGVLTIEFGSDGSYVTGLRRCER